MLRSVFLGVLQGLTEFLPVSSSGHLALSQQFMDMGGDTLTFDILLHAATMLATIIYFRIEIWSALKGWSEGFMSSQARKAPEWILGWAVIAGNIFTVIIALMLKPMVEIWVKSTFAVSSALLVTSAVLFLASSISPGREARTDQGGKPTGPGSDHDPAIGQRTTGLRNRGIDGGRTLSLYPARACQMKNWLDWSL